ncbi:MAG: 4Fe-4S dicluster domain-containing protein [Opitutales bacterium]
MIPLRNLPGLGMLKGMVVTGHNFIASYFDRERLVTVQYPEKKRTLPENSRNFPFLVFDGEDPEEGLRCTSCRMCEKECPPQVIHIVQARDKNGKPRKHPEVFEIDTNACMSCQICVEVCPFESIKMDSAYEYAETEHFRSLILHKEQLTKSNRYYHSIKPTEATAVDEGLEAERRRKEEAKAKREAAASAKAKAADKKEATKSDSDPESGSDNTKNEADDATS